MRQIMAFHDDLLVEKQGYFNSLVPQGVLALV